MKLVFNITRSFNAVVVVVFQQFTFNLPDGTLVGASDGELVGWLVGAVDGTSLGALVGG